jgi:cytidine deaminase
VLSESGEIFSGCNVENASYGLTMCAERVAIGQAVSKGQRRVTAVAVYTPTPSGTTPCGACRQVIFEFGPDCTIVCVHDGPNADVYSAGELLPHGFGPTKLRSG